MADDGKSNDQGAGQDGKQPETPSGPARGRMLTDQETADWGLEMQIEEKTPLTEQNALRKEFEDASAGKEGDDAGADKKTEEETPPDTQDEPDKAEENAVQTIEDPGEFQPSDYSFEVTVFNEKGEKPRQVKVESIDAWEKLLEDEPNLGSSVAVNKAFRAAQRMESGIEREQAEHEAAVKEYQEAVQQQEVVQQRNTTIEREMRYLMSKGDLPQLTEQEITDPKLNWDDPAVLKAHPNIAPHKELLAYMRKENATRLKAGLTPLSSALDAYNAMQLDGRRQSDIEARRAAGEARKAAGARVASGTSTPLSAAQPKGIAVGRVGDLSYLGQNWNT